MIQHGPDPVAGLFIFLGLLFVILASWWRDRRDAKRERDHR